METVFTEDAPGDSVYQFMNDNQNDIYGHKYDDVEANTLFSSEEKQEISEHIDRYRQRYRKDVGLDDPDGKLRLFIAFAFQPFTYFRESFQPSFSAVLSSLSFSFSGTSVFLFISFSTDTFLPSQEVRCLSLKE